MPKTNLKNINYIMYLKMDDFNCDTILSEFRTWRRGHSSISREDVFILFDCLLLSKPFHVKRKLYQFPSDLKLEKSLSDFELALENKLKIVQKSFLLSLLDQDEVHLLECVARLREQLNLVKDVWDTGKILCIGNPNDVQRVLIDLFESGTGDLSYQAMCLDLDAVHLISRMSIVKKHDTCFEDLTVLDQTLDILYPN